MLKIYVKEIREQSWSTTICEICAQLVTCKGGQERESVGWNYL